MSYINVVTVSEDAKEQLGLENVMGDLHGTTGAASFRDGEEMIAVQDLIRRLNELQNGELLIIEVDKF